MGGGMYHGEEGKKEKGERRKEICFLPSPCPLLLPLFHSLDPLTTHSPLNNTTTPATLKVQTAFAIATPDQPPATSH